MPRIKPPPGPTGWPIGELAIGVVGVAPWATLEFCRALYGLIGATKDWHYPRLLIDANSKIPSRGRHLDLGEPDPSPHIRATIEELVGSGAGVVVVPCNTAHLLYERWASGAAVPVPHIMNVSVERAVELGANSVAVLESGTLRASGAYVAAVHERGLRTIPLSDLDATIVATLIAGVKLCGKPLAEDVIKFSELARALVQRGADALLLGCTELGVFAGAVPSGCHVIDSNVELARAAAQLAGCAVRTE